MRHAVSGLYVAGYMLLPLPSYGARMTEDEELAAARVKARLRADLFPPIYQAPRHACPSCGMVHFVQGGGR